MKEGSEEKLCASLVQNYQLKASSVSPCENIPSVHVCECQHLSVPEACSMQGTPARQLGCTPAPAPQEKKESGFLAAERFMTCVQNFYLNPENRTGLSFNSQANSSSRRWSSGSPSPSLFLGLLLSDLQLLLLLLLCFGSSPEPDSIMELWHLQKIHTLLQMTAALLQCCLQATALRVCRQSLLRTQPCMAMACVVVASC